MSKISPGGLEIVLDLMVHIVSSSFSGRDGDLCGGRG